MMDEKRLDEVLRDLPRSFNPPAQPPLDDMWAVIEDAHFNAPASVSSPRRIIRRAPWLAAAAALVIGIGIGRYIPSLAKTSDNPPPPMMASAKKLASDTSAVGRAHRA